MKFLAQALTYESCTVSLLTHPSERPHWNVRRQRGRFKVETAKVNETREGEITWCLRAYAGCGWLRLVIIVVVGPTLHAWVHSVIAVVVFALVTGHAMRAGKYSILQ